MKVCTIIGRVTKDSQIQENERGGFLKFSVAVDDGYGASKGTIFFDVDYNRTGIAQYVTKGKQVGVSGELKTREYNGKTYLSIRANDVKLIGGQQRQQVMHTEHEPQRAAEGQTFTENQLDDEIPFN
jgi:single-strand DNA-binding protein